MKIANADVLVLSACVQMPSLAVVPKVEALTGKPVVTASIATAYALLRALNLEPVVPGAGALLSGAYRDTIVSSKSTGNRRRCQKMTVDRAASRSDDMRQQLRTFVGKTEPLSLTIWCNHLGYLWPS
jgi:hypothetical protein